MISDSANSIVSVMGGLLCVHACLRLLFLIEFACEFMYECVFVEFEIVLSTGLFPAMFTCSAAIYREPQCSITLIAIN